MTDRPEDPPNEILAAARMAREHRDRSDERQRRWPIAAIGIGVGIGSAAVAAALLYANRSRQDRKD